MFPYGFVPGPNTLGIGTGNQGFERSQTIPVNSIYGPRYNVKDEIDATARGTLVLYQKGPMVDLQANGVYFSGTLALSALSEFETQKGK